MSLRKLMLVLIILSGCFYHGIAQQADLTGTYTGKLVQSGNPYPYNMILQLKQTGSSISGTLRDETTDGSGFFVVYNIEGSADDNSIEWRDVSVADEQSNEKWFWCRKKVRARILMSEDSLLLSCDWKMDGKAMFSKKELVENSGVRCEPGHFRLTKKREAKAPDKDTSQIIIAALPTKKAADTSRKVKAATAKKVVDTSRKVIAAAPVKKAIDTSRKVAVIVPVKKAADTSRKIVAVTPVKKAADTSRRVKAVTAKKVADTSRKVVAAAPARKAADTSRKAISATVPVKKPVDSSYVIRKVQVKQTFEVVSDSVQLSFYDNGAVDNDTITVYYNNAVFLNRQRLSTRPLVITVPVQKNGTNELVMFANNEGDIPPNTALLVFTVGGVRREITLESSLSKSASIIFTKK